MQRWRRRVFQQRELRGHDRRRHRRGLHDLQGLAGEAIVVIVRLSRRFGRLISDRVCPHRRQCHRLGNGGMGMLVFLVQALGKTGGPVEKCRQEQTEEWLAPKGLPFADFAHHSQSCQPAQNDATFILAR